MTETTTQSTGKQQNDRLMRLATYASVTVACVLIASKFVAWIYTDSVSLLSTLIDSVLDVAASMVNLIAVHHSLQPADHEHRFGHGKAEALSGLAQAAFISGSAAFLLIEAVQRMFEPKLIENTEIGYAVMVFSIVLTLLLVAFQRYVVRRSGSVAISADSLHYQTDVLINLSVIVSLAVVSIFDLPMVDPLIALAIVFYIVRGAIKIGLDSLNILMDRELSNDDREKINALVLDVDGVLGVHDLRTRSSGSQVFIQMHVEMDGQIPLSQAHEIADRVEHVVNQAYPMAEVIVHEDPEGLAEHHADFS